MKILFLADLHDTNYDNLNKIKQLDFDICILLGDINMSNLRYITSIVDNEKLFGIVGNHDTFDMLNRVNIYDLNNKVIDINGIKICGFGGGVKYKHGMYAMLSQDDAKKQIEVLSSCDIFVTHETGYHYIKTDLAHEGFIGIDEYINKYSPKYNVFGHYHQNLDFMKNTTRCICVYQCSILDTKENQIKNIF